MSTAGPSHPDDEAHWLAQLPQAVLVVEGGRIAYANAAARALFDPAAGRDLAGERAGRLLPETGQACRLDGSRFPIALLSEPTRFDGRPALLQVVRDIEYEQALEQRLEAKRRRLLALSGRLISFQEHERRHIARELHDEIGQSLSALRVQFAKLRRRVEQQPEVLGLIDSAAGLTESTLGRVRSLALLLHPPQLETLGLVAALRWHLQEQEKLYGLRIRFDAGPVREPVPPDVAIAAYRIVQEALSNALRHGRAAQVTVSLVCARDRLTVLVSDDGVGFNPDSLDAPSPERPTLGLLSMMERARLLGGELTLASAAGKGTRIAAFLPLSKDSDSHE